jgi:hypothetical protein
VVVDVNVDVVGLVGKAVHDHVHDHDIRAAERFFWPSSPC